MDDPPETSIGELAVFVFSGEPRPPLSIGLMTDETDNEYIFSALSELLLEGLYVLYGDNFKLEQISTNVIATLNEYMKSIGFTLSACHTKSDECYSYIANIENVPYFFILTPFARRPEALKDFYININDICQLSFDFYYA